MKVTRSRKHHIALGNYEWIEVGAEISADMDIHNDVIPGSTIAALDDALTDLLSEEIAEAREITGEKRSYVHLYQKEL